MKRREFIAGLGGAAAWSLAAWAQQSGRMRRIGMLMGYGEDDPEAKLWLSWFTQALAELGWTDGGNLRMDVRWGAANVDRARIYAKELVDLQPDVILAHTTPMTAALQGETRTIPIVFVNVADPIGSGFVASLPRPGGNMTGFISWEASMAAKWLELLTEIAPSVKRVAILFNPDTATYAISYFLPPFEAAARRFKLEPILAPVHSDGEIETAITSLGREPGGGLLVVPDSFIFVHRAPILFLTARYNLPVVHNLAAFVRDGGLLSYGADEGDNFRRATPYVDRILRGAKPADLPVQLPVKFVMTLNARTAKSLGLTIPETLLATADEVIE
jgi:putative tryptophan/tyrosine transport system substrate-binding protein